MTRLVSSLMFGVLALSAQDLKIVVNSAAVLKNLQAAGPIPQNVRLVAPERANLAKELTDADGYIGIDPQSVEFLRGAKKLRWVQVPSAGLEKVLDWKGPNALRDSNIVVTNYRILQ